MSKQLELIAEAMNAGKIVDINIHIQQLAQVMDLSILDTLSHIIEELGLDIDDVVSMLSEQVLEKMKYECSETGLIRKDENPSYTFE